MAEGNTKPPRRQPRDEHGWIEGGDALANAVTEAWVDAWRDPPEPTGPIYVDPDFPVWGNVTMDEVR